MFKQEERATGIILESRPFEDAHKILNVFTFESGLIKLFIQNAERKALPLQPYCKMEFVYRKGKSDLDYYLEAKLIKTLPVINKEDPKRGLLEIHIAHHLRKTLLRTLCTSQPAPQLYLLFEAYLTTLPLVNHPENLLCSFQLKWMVYEGILLIENQCKECHIPLQESYYCSGEPFCKLHARPDSLYFSGEETRELSQLTQSRSISEVDEPLITFELSKKIELLMEQLLR